MDWSPYFIFTLCYCAATLGGLGATVKTRQKAGQFLTLYDVFAAFAFSGTAGTSFAMVGFEYLGGKAKPWQVIGSSGLLGLGIIKIPDAAAFLKRFLIAVGPSDDNDSPKDG